MSNKIQIRDIAFKIQIRDIAFYNTNMSLRNKLNTEIDDTTWFDIFSLTKDPVSVKTWNVTRMTIQNTIKRELEDVR